MTFSQVAARFVKITVTDNSANTAAHVEEIKIYQGTPSPSPTPTPTATPTPTSTSSPTPTPNSHTNTNTNTNIFPYTNPNSQTPTPTPTPVPTTTPTPSPTPTPQPGAQIPAISATASTYNGITYEPQNAIDNIETTTNYWGTSATNGLPQWLKIDLGTTNTIGQIITHFYDGNTRTYTYHIETSNDALTWTTIVPTKTASGIVTDTFTQVNARYVRITITGNTANTAAHIEEIKIYQSTGIPTPIPTPSPTPTSTPTPTPTPSPTPTPTPQPGAQIPAISATASTYNGITYEPQNAIDNIETTTNYWGTSATNGLPQWLKIDLGTTNTIGQIITHFYDGNTRTYTYHIETSNDALTWTTIVPTKTASGIVTDTFTQVNARYVRITVTGNTANTAAHIEEIKIYQSTGIPTPIPTPSPTPTSTPTPTPTPSPHQPQHRNLALKSPPYPQPPQPTTA